MTRTSRVAAVGLALLTIALVGWARCGGTSPERTPVDVAPTPERAPAPPTALPRRASDKTPTNSHPAPVDPETSTPSTSDDAAAPNAPTRDEFVLHVTDERNVPLAAHWTWFGGGGVESGETDAAGVAQISATSSPCRLIVFAKPVEGRVFVLARDVAVGATEREVRVRLREGAAIDGRLVDEHGDAVRGVDVTAIGPDGFHDEFTTTDDGSFRIPAPVGAKCGLRLGNQYGTLLFPDDEYDGALDGVAAGATGVVFRCRHVTKDRALSVVVVDPSGAKRPGADVDVSLVAVVATQVADREGRCKFRELPARELTVEASTPGAAPDDLYAPALPVTVVPDGQEIVMQLRRAHIVKVALVDAAGAPYFGSTIEVRALLGARDLAWSKPDASGRVTLKIPPDGAGAVRIEVRSRFESVMVLASVDIDVPTDREIRIVVAR